MVHLSLGHRLDIHGQGSFSPCLNCNRADWISGGTVVCSNTKFIFKARPAGPGAPESEMYVHCTSSEVN
ncbi:Hypothetical protein SMAX5B_012665 [Scophthalmus maximus]|uniref:Uncharacterized protein n=1 Tax=Scophthalmus maximus TaxID=52904 RepID=A0A2U9BD56_SCOMX|nr:Hypothetical protein SMAX5B_012665 [Scophthalmus maximus]